MLALLFKSSIVFPISLLLFTLVFTFALLGLVPPLSEEGIGRPVIILLVFVVLFDLTESAFAFELVEVTVLDEHKTVSCFYSLGGEFLNQSIGWQRQSKDDILGTEKGRQISQCCCIEHGRLHLEHHHREHQMDPGHEFALHGDEHVVSHLLRPLLRPPNQEYLR